MKNLIASAAFLILCYGLSAWADARAAAENDSERIHISFPPRDAKPEVKHIIRHETLTDVTTNLKELCICESFTDSHSTIEAIRRIMNMFGRMTICDLAAVKGVKIPRNEYNLTHGWENDDIFDVTHDYIPGVGYMLNLPRVKRLEND